MTVRVIHRQYINNKLQKTKSRSGHWHWIYAVATFNVVYNEFYSITRLLKLFKNNLIWCDESKGHIRPYITAKFRKNVFSNLHGLGHPSHKATRPLINTRFVWHGMNIDIAKWCRSCKDCQTAKISRHIEPVFGKFAEPTERFDHVHINIVGPLPYANSFRYLLTCVDCFTRWPEAIPLVDIRAETVADAFFSKWIARFGTPGTIIRDRGVQFESKLWDGLCNQFEIVRNRTTSYHPQVEWHGRTLPPSAKSNHYGTRVTEYMDDNTTCCITRHSFRR